MDIRSKIMLSLFCWSSQALERIRREREPRNIRSVLLLHRRNQVLPLAWADQFNNVPFQAVSKGAVQIDWTFPFKG